MQKAAQIADASGFWRGGSAKSTGGRVRIIPELASPPYAMLRSGDDSGDLDRKLFGRWVVVAFQHLQGLVPCHRS